MRNTFPPFWAKKIRSVFLVVFRIWCGTLFKFFIQVCILRQVSQCAVYYYSSSTCFHQMTDCTLLINYFTLNDRVGGLRTISIWRPFTRQKKLVRTRQKKRYGPITFVKKHWSFYRAIGAYGPAETPVFLYKSYGSVPLFWRVRTQIFLSCKRPSRVH